MNNNKHDVMESENTLFLLKEIESNPQVTQRYLSEKFSISLGKVNYLINCLIKKGLIKVENFKNSRNKLAYLYLFTPKGINAKINLTQKFLEFKLQEYERLKKEIERYRNEAILNNAPHQITKIGKATKVNN